MDFGATAAWGASFHRGQERRDENARPHPSPLPRGEGARRWRLSWGTLWPRLWRDRRGDRLRRHGGDGRAPSLGGEGWGEGGPSLSPQSRCNDAPAASASKRDRPLLMTGPEGARARSCGGDPPSTGSNGHCFRHSMAGVSHFLRRTSRSTHRTRHSMDRPGRSMVFWRENGPGVSRNRKRMPHFRT